VTNAYWKGVGLWWRSWWNGLGEGETRTDGKKEEVQTVRETTHQTPLQQVEQNRREEAQSQTPVQIIVQAPEGTYFEPMAENGIRMERRPPQSLLRESPVSMPDETNSEPILPGGQSMHDIQEEEEEEEVVMSYPPRVYTDSFYKRERHPSDSHEQQGNGDGERVELRIMGEEAPRVSVDMTVPSLELRGFI